MKLIYEGTDITPLVQIRSCVCRDVSGGRSDSLDITLAGSETWHRWNPITNDRIEIQNDGFRSGILYIQAVVPTGDDYRILATAARSAALKKKYDTYFDKTLDGICSLLSAECKMGYRIYGPDGRTRYPYWQRNMESAPAVLSRIAELEGAVLKTYNGQFTMIGIEEAQKLPALERITIDSTQAGVRYERRESEKYSAVTLTTYAGRVTVRDKNAKWGKEKIIADLPADDIGTAGRWARGLLLSHNRKAERLTLETHLHTDWSAMVRIDVAGGTEADGEWIIDEVTHDLIRKTSKAEMVRVVRTQ